MNIRFQIKLSPVLGGPALSLEKQGATLKINGETFDFNALGQGDLLPHVSVLCAMLQSDVERQGDDISLTLLCPHGEDASPEELFPAPLSIAADDFAFGLPWQEEQVAGVIDWGQKVSAGTRAASDLAKRHAKAKAECARRIIEVADIVTQNNLSVASQLNKLSGEEQAIFSAGYDWIRSMQAAWPGLAVQSADISDDTNWPAVPPGVAELAALY